MQPVSKPTVWINMRISMHCCLPDQFSVISVRTWSCGKLQMRCHVHMAVSLQELNHFSLQIIWKGGRAEPGAWCMKAAAWFGQSSIPAQMMLLHRFAL